MTRPADVSGRALLSARAAPGESLRWPLAGELAGRAPRGAANRSSSSSPARAAWKALRARRGAWRSLWFLAGVSFLALAAPLLPLPSPAALDPVIEPSPPVPPWEQIGNDRFQPEYWPLSSLDQALVDARRGLFGSWQTGPYLGTDGKGRDLLSRIVWGSRTSLLVGLAAALTSLAIGVTWGLTAAWCGGRIDRLMMRTVDVLQSLPFVFVVIFVLSMLSAPRSDLSAEPLVEREHVFFAVIGAVWWLSMARVVRAQALSLRGSAFVQSARALGASGARILWSHLAPNVLPLVVVYLTLTVPAVILFESFLSFLGLGVEPPRVSWGLLALDGAEAINPLQVPWWLVLFPALAMASTLLALNVLGDGLRDALDPRSRGGKGGP